jgi:hypothetical protein
MPRAGTSDFYVYDESRFLRFKALAFYRRSAKGLMSTRIGPSSVCRQPSLCSVWTWRSAR